MKDIYFDENYGKLYEKIENGKLEIFKYQDENGIISSQFIKRKINITIDKNEYFDITTPYGYGGPIIEECTGNKEKLLENYEKKFEKYCKKNNIISEFIRFHPLYKNYNDFKGIYNAKFNRYTLATNIKDFDNPIQFEFSKSCRKEIRRILRLGITFRMIESPTIKNMNDFVEIYKLNMERKNADDFYFFDEEYFEDILNNFDKKIVIAEAIYNEKVVAAGLYFVTNKIIHAHLSGTNTEYIQLSPAYILKYGTALWAKEHGIDYIHYGGGTDSNLENSLYVFKRKFSQNTQFEFWTGKKIWNVEVYNKLCQKRNIDKEEFFPAYRKGL